MTDNSKREKADVIARIKERKTPEGRLKTRQLLQKSFAQTKSLMQERKGR